MYSKWRSLNNKSAAFLYLVYEVRADFFAICEIWLKDHHSVVLSEASLLRPDIEHLYIVRDQAAGAAVLHC